MLTLPLCFAETHSHIFLKPFVLQVIDLQYFKLVLQQSTDQPCWHSAFLPLCFAEFTRWRKKMLC